MSTGLFIILSLDMEEKLEQTIKTSIEELLDKMGFPGQVSIVEDEENPENVICNVTTDSDSNFLIGQHGINLQAVQHLARLIIRKKTDEKIRFILDVNAYRQQKNASIVDLAKEAASQALSEKRAVMLKPMSTYERRIVHMELSKNEKVVTESVGEGEGRKIVVKPANALE